MPRVSTFEVPLDTALFSPVQLQPRAMLTLGMSGWARWLREYWSAFPWLLRDHQFGVVVCAFDLAFLRPFGFFDAEALRFDTEVRLRQDGRLIYLDAVAGNLVGNPVLRGRATLRPVQIGDGLSLGAQPATAAAAVRAVFRDDETVAVRDPDYARKLPSLLEQVRRRPQVAEAEEHFLVHRGLCEVADQWSAVAVTELAAAAREALASRDPALAQQLGEPMDALHVEFRRAAFFLDRVVVKTAVHEQGRARAFVHTYENADTSEELAVLIELFGRAG